MTGQVTGTVIISMVTLNFSWIEAVPSQQRPWEAGMVSTPSPPTLCCPDCLGISLGFQSE